MESVKVSVIVAVYNIENYIARCVDSILAQTYSNLEIFLVDDGSTDASPAICDAYASKDTRIRVIHKQNGGLSDARNAALHQMTGDYVGFVDGDDWVEPDMFRAMVEACESNQAEIAICRYNRYREEKKDPGTLSKPSGVIVPMTQKEAYEVYLCGHEQYVIYNSVWSKLFKAEIAKQFDFPVGRYSEDILYTTWTFCEAKQIVYLDTPYYNYVMDRADSIMNRGVYERRMKHELPNWREQIAYLRKKGMNDLADKAAYYFYRRVLFYYMEFQDAKAQGQMQITGENSKEVLEKQKQLHRISKTYAKQIAKQLQADKKEIRRLLKLPFAAKGDVARMQLFLISPGGYSIFHHLYERVIIPLKSR